MRDLIRQLLREYRESSSILVYEIVVSKNLNESGRGKLTFVRKLRKLPPPEVDLFKNRHSQLSIGTKSIQRVDPNDIDESLKEFNVTETIILSAEKIIKECSENCSLNVIDYSAGFDYHMWMNKTETGKIQLIINTSINHPKHLYRSKSSPLITIYPDSQIFTENI
jgi:hypothetical protein